MELSSFGDVGRNWQRDSRSRRNSRNRRCSCKELVAERVGPASRFALRRDHRWPSRRRSRGIHPRAEADGGERGSPRNGFSVLYRFYPLVSNSFRFCHLAQNPICRCSPLLTANLGFFRFDGTRNGTRRAVRQGASPDHLRADSVRSLTDRDGLSDGRYGRGSSVPRRSDRQPRSHLINDGQPTPTPFN
jgi:hypothetical protein